MKAASALTCHQKGIESFALVIITVSWKGIFEIYRWKDWYNDCTQTQKAVTALDFAEMILTQDKISSLNNCIDTCAWYVHIYSWIHICKKNFLIKSKNLYGYQGTYNTQINKFANMYDITYQIYCHN